MFSKSKTLSSIEGYLGLNAWKLEESKKRGEEAVRKKITASSSIQSKTSVKD